jgi:HipA-like protein
MIKQGLVYYNNILAGTLEYTGSEFVFRYNENYLSDTFLPSISLSLPKTKQEYRSSILFPFFYGLLAEGSEKALQCSLLKIDPQDHFSRLLKTAGSTTIGAVTVKEAL